MTFYRLIFSILIFLGASQIGLCHSFDEGSNVSGGVAPSAVQAQISSLETQHLEEIERLKKTNQTKDIILLSVMTILAVSLIFIWALYKKKKMRSAEFENLNLLKDMIFQVIAHDLRSPLYNFRSLLQMAENNYLEKEEYEEYLKTIQHELSGITSATESLLRWAQSNQKKLNIKKRNVKVRATCQDIKDTFRYDLNEKEIVLESNFSDDFSIYTDPDLFSFILRNLIQNAIKFSFVKSKVDAKATETEKEIIIEIVDHGKGMTDEQIRNINAKVSAPGRDVSGFKSAGLGMIICKDFAERLNMELTVHSEPEKGTTFTLVIPKGE